MTQTAIKQEAGVLTVPAGIASKDVLGMDHIAEFIRQQILPQEHAAPVFNFFEGSSAQRIVLFQEAHRISDQDLKTYYEMHIQNEQPNAMLEDMLEYVEKFAGVTW